MARQHGPITSSRHSSIGEGFIALIIASYGGERDGWAMVAGRICGSDIEVREFASQIYAAVRDGRLKEPFAPDDIRRVCPGWAAKTYTVFLSKHRVDNPEGTTELFERVAPGYYRTLPNLRTSN